MYTTTRIIEQTTWHYSCPDCKEPQGSSYEPRSNNDMRCHPCHLLKVKQDFVTHFAPFIGATVTEIVSNDDPDFEQDAKRLYLVDGTEQRWEVTSDAPVYVYRVDEDGKAVRDEPGQTGEAP